MSFLSRTLLCKGMMGGLGSRAISIRNINQLHPRFSPMLSSSLISSNQKSMEVVPARKSSTAHNHVPLWSAEKAFSLALLPIIPAAFICPSATMDYLLAFTVTLHSHWGIEAIVVDYIRPSVFGEVVPKIAIALLYAFSAVTLGGLCYFTYSDVGLVAAIKMLWKL